MASRLVERERAADLAAALGLNYRGFLGCCLPAQLTIFVDVLEVQADIVVTDVEQLGHLALAEPDGLMLGTQLDLAFAVFGGVEDQHTRHPHRGVSLTCCIMCVSFRAQPAPTSEV